MPLILQGRAKVLGESRLPPSKVIHMCDEQSAGGPDGNDPGASSVRPAWPLPCITSLAVRCCADGGSSLQLRWQKGSKA